MSGKNGDGPIEPEVVVPPRQSKSKNSEETIAAKRQANYDATVKLLQAGMHPHYVATAINVSRVVVYRFQARARREGLVAKAPVAPGKRGGPQIQITPEQLVELGKMARAHATRKEMAVRLGIDEDTLAARIRDNPSVRKTIEDGKVELQLSLRRKRLAIAFNDKHPAQAAMLKSCFASILGESEKVTLKIENEGDAMTALLSMFPDAPADLIGALKGEIGDGDGEAVH